MLGSVYLSFCILTRSLYAKTSHQIRHFQKFLKRSKKPNCGLPKLKSMSTLQNPIATIIRDSTGSMTSYMLVLEDLVESGFEDYNHPNLL